VRKICKFVFCLSGFIQEKRYFSYQYKYTYPVISRIFRTFRFVSMLEYYTITAQLQRLPFLYKSLISNQKKYSAVVHKKYEKTKSLVAFHSTYQIQYRCRIIISKCVRKSSQNKNLYFYTSTFRSNNNCTLSRERGREVYLRCTTGNIGTRYLYN
jgi:hypothetical protein